MSRARTASSHWRVVLVRPRFAGNLGACARVAANFGIRDIVLVDPSCRTTDDEAQKYATGVARECLSEMRMASSVEAAIADCSAAIGFTRRHGELRTPSLAVGEIPSLSGKIALVFGNEETGLTSTELRPCTHLCTIPTSEELGSMNLSHAVAVVLSRLYEHELGVEKRERKTSRQAVAEMESLFAHWRDFLIDIGLKQAGNPDRMLDRVRPLLNRAVQNQRDVRLLRGILSKAQVALGTRKRGRRI